MRPFKHGVAEQASPSLLASLREQLTVAVGSGIGVACRGVNGDLAELWPVEQAAIGRAVAKRQQEFAAGRAAARHAMSQIGATSAAIPVAADRSPIWPTGVVGSITHNQQVCVALAGWRENVHAIGLDLEEDAPLAPTLWETLCTAGELAQLALLAPDERGWWVTRLFCAKEAFYKWQYPQTGCMLEFHQVEIKASHNGERFSVHATASTEAPFPICGQEGHWMRGHGLLLAWLIGKPA